MRAAQEIFSSNRVQVSCELSFVSNSYPTQQSNLRLSSRANGVKKKKFWREIFDGTEDLCIFLRNHWCVDVDWCVGVDLKNCDNTKVVTKPAHSQGCFQDHMHYSFPAEKMEVAASRRTETSWLSPQHRFLSSRANPHELSAPRRVPLELKIS